MLNETIGWSLRNRFLVVVAAVLVTAYGLWVLARLPVDVFPDLNRPTVTLMIEAAGLAPEEVETQVTIPIETVLNGAPGVERVRSSSGIGLSVVWAEFAWSTDIMRNRQIVQERLAQLEGKLPANVSPVMAPISSIMGEIMLIGLTSTDMDPLDIRDTADWVVRPRLLSIPGVSQVTVMGGGVRQYQVLADPERLRRYGITFEELESSLRKANANSGGGFVVAQNQEILVRNLGRVRTLDDIKDSLVVLRGEVPIKVRDVAEVTFGSGYKRGDGGVNGHPAVIMAVQKQPGGDTRGLSKEVGDALKALGSTLPKGLIIDANLFRQEHFIDSAISNVEDALRDGVILVVIVLALFLMNFRTTAITLTAIPLSLLCTALVFSFFGLSINTMTLGGIAVAIGELVDDAIVGVENVLRRLKENRHLPNPLLADAVIYTATSEVRGSIVYGTAVVLLVFMPLFALSGIEGRLFQPLAIAYIVSILVSLVVSITVSPALSSYLLPGLKRLDHREDGAVLRGCKWIARRCYNFSLPRPKIILGTAALLVIIGVFIVSRLGVEFLPPFNEGTATISVSAMPGISLDESNRLGTLAEELILSVPEVKSVGRRTGRAEQDEHAEGVNSSEIDVDFWTMQETKKGTSEKTAFGRVPPASLRERTLVLAEIRERLEDLPGIFVNVGQPISHRIDHLLSGVRAQIAVKVSGTDMGMLRTKAKQVENAIHGIRGVVDLQVEQQVLVPQLRLRVNRAAAARYGFTSEQLTDLFATALGGKALSQVVNGQRFYDLVMWTGKSVRRDAETIANLRLVSPSGAIILLSDVADVVDTPGPNQINRENVTRRIVVFCNVQGRDLGGTVKDIQESVSGSVSLPQGYAITYGGQFEAQQRATQILLILGACSMVAMFALLYFHFRSAALVTQVMLNIPFAFIGAVLALVIAREPFSVASLVGFISLTGISARNGILMIAHYVHLMSEEGVPFGRDLVIRGSQERVAPVLMTALTAGLGLVPLVLSAGQPGKEILYPVAVVILGGLITSTLLDFIITPTVFFNYSGKAAVRVAQRKTEERQKAMAAMGVPAGTGSPTPVLPSGEPT